MKIKDIYYKRNDYNVSMFISLLCVIVTIIAFFKPDLYYVIAYAYPIEYVWQLFSGIFLHGAPDLSIAYNMGHLIFNLLLVVTFGIMIENILGSKRFVLMSLVLWIANAASFYIIASNITPQGESAYGVGISGVTFAYGILGAYVLFTLGKRNLKLLLKQASFYFLLSVFIGMIIMLHPGIAGTSSMIIHLGSVAIGIIYTICYRNVIYNFFETGNKNL